MNRGGFVEVVGSGRMKLRRLLRSKNPADQEKAIVYNELVIKAVALQTVVDQTRTLHALKSKGVSVQKLVPEVVMQVPRYPAYNYTPKESGFDLRFRTYSFDRS